MPWEVRRDGDRFCVVKISDDSTVACHASAAEARAQVRALYASEDERYGVNALAFAVDVLHFAKERDVNAPGPGGHDLFQHWVRGPGAARIRWGTDGSMDRCTALLGRHVADAGGLCAEYHKAATGEWPRGGTVESAAETIVAGFDPSDPSAWEGVLAVEGEESGDGRQFANRSLLFDDFTDGRMPFDWQKTYSHGGTGDETVRVGTIWQVWRDGNRIMGRGNFDLGGPDDDDAHEAFRRVQAGTLTGTSVVMDSTKDRHVERVYGETPAQEVGGIPLSADVVAMVFGTPEKEIYHKGRVRGATLVEYPAFTDARIRLLNAAKRADDDEDEDEDERPRKPTRSGAYALGADHFALYTAGPWHAPAHAARLARRGSLKLASALRAFGTVGHVESGRIRPEDCALLHHEVDGDGIPGPANLRAVVASLHALELLRLPPERVEAARAHLTRHLEVAGVPIPETREPVVAAAGAAVEERGVHVITIPDVPPAGWFDEPTDVAPHGALTVTDQGRVYGWLAPAGVAHRSFKQRRVYAPTNVDLTRFLGGETLVAGGRRVCGNVTMGCGHADPHDVHRSDPNWAPEHYDNTCSVFAHINAGIRDGSTWVAGALVAGVTPEQVVKAMGCRLSGDWQPIPDQPGRYELVAALLVPVPGFAIARTRVSTVERDGVIVASSVPVRFAAHGADADPAIAERLARGRLVERLQVGLDRSPAQRVAVLRGRVHGGAVRALRDQVLVAHGRYNQEDHGN